MAKNQENLRDAPWAEMRDILGSCAHDDIRDLSFPLNDMEEAVAKHDLPEQWADRMSELVHELTSLHRGMAEFRVNKNPSQAEIDRYLLDYLGKLEIAKKEIGAKLNQMQTNIAKIKSPEARADVLNAINGLREPISLGHTSLFLEGKTQPEIKRQSLRRIVEDYVKKGIRDRENKLVKVVIRGKDRLAYCDERLVQTSLANLLTDAINHTPGRPIFVKIGSGPKYGHISVTSSGPLLTREERSKIGVERFTRSQDPNRGWGKIGARINTERQYGKWKVGNSLFFPRGPKLTMKFQRRDPTLPKKQKPVRLAPVLRRRLA